MLIVPRCTGDTGTKCVVPFTFVQNLEYRTVGCWWFPNVVLNISIWYLFLQVYFSFSPLILVPVLVRVPLFLYVYRNTQLLRLANAVEVGFTRHLPKPRPMFFHDPLDT
jgi:hypothetical protein